MKHRRKVILGGSLAVVVVALAWYAGNHHVLRTGEGVVVLDKSYFTLGNAFFDARGWTSADFDAHPQVKRAMIAQGHRDYLVDLKAAEYREQLANVGINNRARCRAAGDIVRDWWDRRMAGLARFAHRNGADTASDA